LLVPREAFEGIGGFDESFFLFNEEVDLCHRLRDAGREVRYVNAFSYHHQRDDKDTLWREVLRISSRRHYDRKWLSRRQTLECQLAQSYRWLSHVRHPAKLGDRRLIVPRLLATWNFLDAELPDQCVRHRRTRGLLRVDQTGRLALARPVRWRT
jgi:GT2 family glycosyltransferase